MGFRCSAATHASDISWRCVAAQAEPMLLHNSSTYATNQIHFIENDKTTIYIYIYISQSSLKSE